MAIFTSHFEKFVPVILTVCVVGVSARRVPVSTAGALQTAVNSALSGDTILVADGTYHLERFLWVEDKKNLTLMGASGDPQKAILRGNGFATTGSNQDLLWIGPSENFTVSSLTFEETHGYGIKINAGDKPKNVNIVSCHFRNIGTRHIKGTATDALEKAHTGSVHSCYFENTKIPPADWNSGGNYISAIDLMSLEDWTFSGNVFRNVKGRSGGGRAAIFIWVDSKNIVVENNLIIGCDRGIAFGNPSSSTNGASVHVTNAVCRNNFIVAGPDAGIEIAWSEGVKIYNNTVWRQEQAGRGIRFIAPVKNCELINNLVRGRLEAGAEVKSQTNLFAALSGYFHDPAAGNLHLLPEAHDAIDKGSTLALVSGDWDGEKRPMGNAYDIGADEFPVGTTASLSRESKPPLEPQRLMLDVRDWNGRWLGRFR